MPYLDSGHVRITIAIRPNSYKATRIVQQIFSEGPALHDMTDTIVIRADIVRIHSPLPVPKDATRATSVTCTL